MWWWCQTSWSQNWRVWCDDDVDEIVVDDATGDVEIELVFDDVVNDDTQLMDYCWL